MSRRIWIGTTVVVTLGLVLVVGSQLGAFSFFPTPEEGREPTAVGPEVEIASGSVSGQLWTLSAFNSDMGVCVHVDVQGTVNAQGGGCGFGVAGEVGAVTNLDGDDPTSAVKEIGYSQDRYFESEVTFVYGPVIKGASAVTVDAGSDTYAATVYPAPPGFGVDFYLVAIPAAIAEVDSVLAE